ncbi:MAG: tyrosine-type recombinase/integrase [Candidatus Sigynarchaeota archaeon]
MAEDLAPGDNISLAPDFPADELAQKFTRTNKNENIHYKIKKFKFALSKSQRDALLKTANSHSQKQKFIIETQLHTGMRIGELVNLRIQDVNIGERTIYIQRHEQDEYCEAWHPKTAAGIRIIPMDTDFVASMRGYLRDQKRSRGYLFTTQKQSHYNERAMINKINLFARETKNIGHNIGSHALRRTYASHLINEGVPVGVISRVLGHASIAITMRYLFQIDSPENHDQIREAMKSI